ncbi:carboxylating nicotinate-nucleotide diphosphorylase [Granulicella sibirica]|uniref:nicotinate-nucleotide diphosphorylase (carboxylating) n=1 Tax=Granulicella sibirica TaxID=2479048 RepID=A0A4Q0T2S6_9BACT|nr:carboxylating nicotinate-nucleotide diphosphorylase [Granulicella sibirica]RXH57923.1 Quinolinate phosphoribosyltransferase [decarboxylating] [Granulicella sibirica]
MDWKSRRIRTILEAALAEDKAANDVTTVLTVEPGLRATGTIVAKQPCVISGVGAIPAILDIFGKMVSGDNPGNQSRFEVVSHLEIFDGVRVKKGQTIAVIRHHAAAILSCERVMLNLIQRMSGIATLTNAYVKALSGTNAKVVDTRKTIPGLRALDKYAVCCGGGTNHRLDLQDGILIKASHIGLGGGLPSALEHALAKRKPGQRVEVEVRSQEELDQALAGGAEAILLEGMAVAAVKKAVKQIRDTRPGIPIEASGNITLDTVKSFGLTGVDFVSVAALTQSPETIDMGMRVTANVF